MESIDVKKVYVVLKSDVDGDIPVKVYSEEEDAESYCDEQDDGCHYFYEECDFDYPEMR